MAEALSFDIFARDRASDVFKRLGANVDGTKAKFTGFQKAGLALAGSLVALGVASVKAFSDAQKSQDQLAFAFQKFPRLADISIKSLQDYDSALQKKTRFEDDTIASGQAVLAQFGLTGRQLKELTPLLLDYAAKTGQDLPAAAEALGKGLLGNGKALKAIGLNIKDTGTATGNYTQLVAGLRKQVGGFAESEGKTFAGQIAILKNQFNDLEETLGSKLVPILTTVVGALIATTEAFGKLPGPVKVGILAITAIGAAALIAIPKIAALKVAMAELGVTGAGVKAKMSGFISFLGGPWGIALLAATVGLGLFMKHQADAAARVDELSQSLDQQTGALTADSRAIIFHNLQASGAVDAAKKFGLSLQTVTDAASGNVDAITAVDAATGSYLTHRGPLLGAAKTLSGAIHQQNGELADARANLTDTAAAGVQMGDSLKSKVIPPVKDATDAFAEMTQALDESANKFLDARSAQSAYLDSLDKVKQALKENGKGLDVHTAKGRANRDALDSVAQAAIKYKDSVLAQKGPGKEFDKTLETTRAGLVAAYLKFSNNKVAANKYANAILGIPGKASTTITLYGIAQAKANIQDYLAGLAAARRAGVRNVFRAAGGPVQAGRPYVVGENRPELFVPNVSGRIVPRVPAAMSGGGAGGDTYVLNAPNFVGNYDDLLRALSTMVRQGRLKLA